MKAFFFACDRSLARRFQREQTPRHFANDLYGQGLASGATVTEGGGEKNERKRKKRLTSMHITQNGVCE